MGSSRLRNKGWCRRLVRHDDWGFRRGVMDLQVRKSRCLDCGRCFRQPLPGVQRYRFHVIRLVNHHFLACWREIDPTGSKNRGLISFMRRHRHNLKPEQLVRLRAYLAERPALDLIYRFKQRLCYLLLKKHKTRQQCQKLVPRFCGPWSTLSTPGSRRWHACGASPDPTASPRVSITKWRPSADRRTGFATSKITDFE
jgi:hypothetical protein